MGVRLATNLRGSRFTVDHVEVSEEGRQRLKAATGLDCVTQEVALAQADIVLMAVPDRLIGAIAHAIVDKGAGHRFIVSRRRRAACRTHAERADVTYFVTHPCIHRCSTTRRTRPGRRISSAGVSAKQHIVCALMQGPEAHYALCEEVARLIYAPVMDAHRCTVEQIAILEPALSETTAITCASR